MRQRFSIADGKPTWAVAVPIKDGAGNVVGALAKSNALTQVTDRLTNIRLGRTGTSMLFAPDGKLLARTGGLADKELRDRRDHPAFAAAADQAVPGLVRYTEQGKPVLARVKKTLQGWVVAEQMDEAEVLDRVRRDEVLMNQVLIPALGLSLLLAVLTARNLTRPLRRLVAITENIGRGKLNEEVEEASRGDEIGALAGSVMRMTASLRTIMGRAAQPR
jgi:methyl-accepting chemotaxis protein